MREPLEEYLRAFDEYLEIVEALLQSTADLLQLDEAALKVLTDPSLLEALRYVAGPPISADDLKTLADAVLTPRSLLQNPAMTARLIDVIRKALDRRRFPWVLESREPTEEERGRAVLASAALLATRHLETSRRNTEKQDQEERVATLFQENGLDLVKRRKVTVLSKAPAAGSFCGESLLGTRKADFLVGLFDGRVMPIECKVSNSATNSVKRLNNDAAAKAEAWRKDFGERQVVPTAVLSGVYKLHNLEDAQRRGLALFWAHELEALLDWVRSTQPR